MKSIPDPINCQFARTILEMHARGRLSKSTYNRILDLIAELSRTRDAMNQYQFTHDQCDASRRQKS